MPKRHREQPDPARRFAEECANRLRLEEREQDRQCDGRGHGNQHLNPAKQRHPVRHPVHDQMGQVTAERDAGDERREHRGERVGRIPQDKDERARPIDLVGEGSQPGETQGEEKQRKGSARKRFADRRIRHRPGIGCRRRRHRHHAPGDRPRDQAQTQVARGRDVDGLIDTESSDQVEAARHGAGDRAYGVDGIEGAQFGARRREPPDDEPREHRQRRPHEESRHHDEAEGQDEARYGERRFGMSRKLVERDVHGRDPRQQIVRGQRREPDPDLQAGIEAQRVGVAVRCFSEEPASQRQSRHERRQHDPHGGGRRSERIREHSDPDDLVDEAAGPGEEKQG
jgi:hypothetical protein